MKNDALYVLPYFFFIQTGLTSLDDLTDDNKVKPNEGNHDRRLPFSRL